MIVLTPKNLKIFIQKTQADAKKVAQLIQEYGFTIEELANQSNRKKLFSKIESKIDKEFLDDWYDGKIEANLLSSLSSPQITQKQPYKTT